MENNENTPTNTSEINAILKYEAQELIQNGYIHAVQGTLLSFIGTYIVIRIANIVVANLLLQSSIPPQSSYNRIIKSTIYLK